MGARYPYYLLADSPEGQRRRPRSPAPPKSTPTHGSIRQGFVYDRVPHITLKSIANNAEIDVIWDRLQPASRTPSPPSTPPLRATPPPSRWKPAAARAQKIDFTATGEVKLPSGEMAPANGFMEWEIPREAPPAGPPRASRPETVLGGAHRPPARNRRQHRRQGRVRIPLRQALCRQLPSVRVAGPFTVESLSPHRTLAVDWDDELIDTTRPPRASARKAGEAPRDFTDFAHMILENLKAAGVQQAHKEDRITFTSLKGWPGDWIAPRAPSWRATPSAARASSSAPEFGTVSRPDLVAAAREAGDAGFDVLIACAFNYDAHPPSSTSWAACRC
jgi:adenine-specific DNA-methyltransferase